MFKNNFKKGQLQKIKDKSAFTLAEILITLGVIGVVSAITMPTLIQNHKKQVYVTNLRKAYSNIQNAFNKMTNDEDVTNWSDTYCLSKLQIGDWRDNPWRDAVCIDKIKKQFNVIDSQMGIKSACCGNYGSGGVCNNRIYSYLCATGNPDAYITTSDGISYIFGIGNKFFIDVNGVLNAPNKYGRDLFMFKIEPDKNKIIPYNSQGQENIVKCTTKAVDFQSDPGGTELMEYCIGKIINDGWKMNY